MVTEFAALHREREERLDRAIRRLEDVRVDATPIDPMDGPTALGLQETLSAGVARLLGVLVTARATIAESGRLSFGVYWRLATYFGERQEDLASRIRRIVDSQNTGCTEQFDRRLTHAEQQAILALLEEEQPALEERLARLTEQQTAEDAALRASLALPPNGASDRILRHKTAYERHRYKAMTELERFQRRRMGEFVPPTVNVSVSKE